MTAPTLDPATESTLWAAIAAAPDDDAFKLIAADWYADNGDAVMEAGLRYCVREGKWPLNVGYSGDPWCWFADILLPYQSNAINSSCVLDDDEWFGMQTYADFPSLPAALRWLGERVTQKEETESGHCDICNGSGMPGGVSGYPCPGCSENK